MVMMTTMKIMGHLFFDLLDFLKKRQSVFHEVFNGHILVMMTMMILMKRVMLNDENDDDDDDAGHKQLSAVACFSNSHSTFI